MNRYFYTEIENLRSRLILMGERTTEVFKMALAGLLEGEIAKCDATSPMDDDIDNLEREIDREAMRYISLRSPVAGDLRTIMVAMKTASNLERIGDESTSIARRSRHILSQGQIAVDTVNIEAMAKSTLEMIEMAKGLFLEPRTDVSESICSRDREIDELNYRNLESYIFAVKANPNAALTYFELSMISKSIERVADHITNVAEDMIYMVEGGDLTPTR